MKNLTNLYAVINTINIPKIFFNKSPGMNLAVTLAPMYAAIEPTATIYSVMIAEIFIV